MTCRSHPFAAVCCVLCVFLSACSGAKDPQISLTSASIKDKTDSAATISLAMRLQNPNNEPLELLEFDYEVEVDGRRVYQGKRSAEMTLARMSTRDMTLPAVVPFDVAGWKLPPGDMGQEGGIPASAKVRVHGTLRYISPGAIEQTLFDTGIRRPRASFKGEQPLQTAPAPAPPATAAASTTPAAPSAPGE